jgi:hypothetical protein
MKYYLEIDNKWDAEVEATSRVNAVKALCERNPSMRGKTIEWMGSESDGEGGYSLYSVGNDEMWIKVRY